MAIETWSEVQLSEIMDVKHGFAFPGEYIREEPTGDILLTPGNFAIGGGFKGDKFKYFDGDVPDEYVLQEGDLVVTMTDLSKQSDTLGYPAIVPKPQRFRFLHNQRLGKVIIRDETKVDKRFLFYLLRTHDYRHEVLASATGTTVKHTSPSRILAYKTLLPPLLEQRAIATILGTLDEKIELLQEMNATLEEIAQAIFRSWFIDFKPVNAKIEGYETKLSHQIANLFTDTFEESSMGRIPSSWKVDSLGTTFDITMGQSPPGETYNEIGEGIPFYQGSTDFTFRFPNRRVYCTAPTRYAKAGDTLISVRAPVGAINMAFEDCAIGRGVAAVRHKTGSRSYTYHFMKSISEVFTQFDGEGTVFGSIGKKDFHAITCVIPPSELVLKYEAYISPLDDRIAANEHEFTMLTSIRDRLLHKLITGDLKLENVERFVGGINQ